MTWREAAAKFAKAFDIPVGDLLGRSHAKAFAYPRHALFLFLKEELQWGTVLIGRRLGRDHSTVQSGCKAALKRMHTSPDFAERYRRACQ